ncbi:MAG: tRNA (5-methylaminomethyl-2-thiouridine)(34)-methyltransferase MnmD [Bacteroidota bacterium]
MKESERHEIVLTADGSHSVHSARFSVDYHSTHGAIQESEHVFIDAGLRPFLDLGIPEIRILEMGFGTGLNVLLVRKLAREYPGTFFRYHALEQFPLDVSEVRKLNYPVLLNLPLDDLVELHACPWEQVIDLEDNFSLEKRRQNFLLGFPNWPSSSMDLLFYDAFAPNSQPELWSPAAIVLCQQILKPGGVLVTYCAKGQYKRDLKAGGFTVEALPGPPGKREMTRGVKQ